MNDKVINEIKLISFYQSLPDELLGKAIANLDETDITGGVSQK